MRLRVVPLFLAVVVTALLTLPASSAQSGPSTPPNGVPWGYSVRAAYVPLGDNATFIVWGAYNGTFNITVYTQPFEKVPAVATYDFNLSFPKEAAVPPDVANFTTPVFKNVSVPTAGLYVGTVMFCIANGLGTQLGCPELFLGSGNFSALQNNLAWLNLNESILQGRELGLFYAEQNLQNQIDTEFWASVALWGSLLFAVIFTRTDLANRRLGRRVRQFFRDTFWRTPHWKFHTGWRQAPPRVKPDVARSWVSDAFPSCLECVIPHAEAHMVRHLQDAHRVADPVPGVDYRRVRGAVKASVARAADTEPDIRVVREHIARIHPDFSKYETPLPKPKED